MKLLVATDGSPISEAAVREISTRPWPPNTAVTVLSAASVPFPTEDGETWDIQRINDELAPAVACRAADQIRRAYDALDEVLDARQQARFRMFEEAIERRKLDLLVRARERAARQGADRR